MENTCKAQGFSMLEILVALVISLVTLMGAAGLVVRTVQQEVESVQRLQALTLVQDMVDRININRQVASCYSNGATGVEVGKDAIKANLPSCAIGNLSQSTRAESDVDEWHDRLLGAAEQTSSSENIGSMLDARGCITQVSSVDRIYRVTVVWQGMSDTVAPANACGQGDYSSELRRRAVSLLVRIGNLT